VDSTQENGNPKVVILWDARNVEFDI